MENSLNEGEPHPMAYDARQFVAKYIAQNPLLIESIASCALTDNRSAQICYSTLARMLHKEPVSDRYVLGLAWFLKNMEESDDGK